MKTSEMFAMLEKNPKLTFVCRNGDNEYFMTSETVFNTYYKSYAKKNGQVITQRGEGDFFGNINFDDNWQVIREPVPSWEAIKALSEGKSIEWHSDNDREILCFSKNDKPESEWAVNLNIFFTGKWYVNE